MSVEKNIETLLDHINQIAEHAGRDPSEISLVVVSKGRTIEEIKQAYWVGCRDFAENRVQEALEKMSQLPSDIRWHFIGKLQTKKINKVLDLFTLIHSIDTPELAKKIAHASVEKGLTTSILLEVNASGEGSKNGLSPKEWEKSFSELVELKGIEINGLMTMAPLTEDESLVRHCFSELRLLRERLQRWINLPALSMGMTNDYPIAIQEGATILRIGTAVFTPQ